jgi:excisionase family DNA binding protein
MSILKKLRERAEPLNVSELAQLLAVTEATFQRWARKRQIPTIRIGDVIRFDPAMLADWIELQAACTGPLASIFLAPRAEADPAEFQMRREDLGELDPEYKRETEKKDQP